MNAASKPEPRRPDPFIHSDPFWGTTPTWVAVLIIIGFILCMVVVGFAVGLMFA